MQEPVEITHGMLATGNKRLLNFIIDSIAATLLQLAIAEGCNRLYEISGNEGFLVGPPLLGNIKYAMLGLGVNIVYYGLFETVSMRTFGKYITNTMVVNRDGTRPDSTRIFLRTLCRMIPFEILSFLGQPPIGWHDNLSKTLVVDITRFGQARQIKDINDVGNNEENNNYE